MNNPPPNNSNELIARALRGQLTEAEKSDFEQVLKENKSLRMTFEEERGLERLLDHLPDAPISSNFTSLVLQVIAPRDADQTARAPWYRFRFVRLAAGLAVVSVAGILTIQQLRKAERTEVAKSLSEFTQVTTAIGNGTTQPGALLRDFDAINRLAIPTDSELDLELLMALQK